MSRFTLQTVVGLDWPTDPGADPTPTWPLPDLLAGAAAGGFSWVGVDAVTLNAYRQQRPSGPDVDELLAGNGLRCVDVGVLSVTDPEPTLAQAELLVAMGRKTGAEVAIGIVGADPNLATTRELFARSVDRLAEAGLRLALEWSPYFGLGELSAARELCHAVGLDRCGLAMDSWMFTHAGAPWDELKDIRADEIAYMQFNDALPDPGADLPYESRHRRTFPGSGTQEVARFAQIIRDAGYDGPVSMEVLSDVLRAMDPAAAARALHQATVEIWPDTGPEG